MMPTDCSVLRTPTTSSCYYSMIFPCLKDFVLCLFQRLLQFSFLVLLLYLKLQPLCLNFDIKNVITIYVKDVGGKSPRLWYLRIVTHYVLPQSYPTFAYRGAYAPLLCSYWGGSQGHSTTGVRAHVVSDLLTRPNMSIKVGRKHHDMRMLGRIVGARSA